MLYYNSKNRLKFQKAIMDEADDLGVVLTMNDLDRRYDYETKDYQDLETLMGVVLEDMRNWFSGDGFNKKELNIAIHVAPWTGEFVRVQTRCKR